MGVMLVKRGPNSGYEGRAETGRILIDDARYVYDS